MERIVVVVVASLLAFSGIVLFGDLAFLRPAMDRQVEVYAVTELPFDLRADPDPFAPAVCRLGVGTTFRLSRRRSGAGWVFVVLGPEAGWVEASALRERAVRRTER